MTSFKPLLSHLHSTYAYADSNAYADFVQFYYVEPLFYIFVTEREKDKGDKGDEAEKKK